MKKKKNDASRWQKKKKKRISSSQVKSDAYQTLLVTYPFLLVYGQRPPDGLSSKTTHFRKPQAFPNKYQIRNSRVVMVEIKDRTWPVHVQLSRSLSVLSRVRCPHSANERPQEANRYEMPHRDEIRHKATPDKHGGMIECNGDGSS